jgi:hypothetical protein
MKKLQRKATRTQSHTGDAERIDELEQLLIDIWHMSPGLARAGRRRQQNMLDAIRDAIKWEIPEVARREVSDPTWLERGP